MLAFFKSVLLALSPFKASAVTASAAVEAKVRIVLANAQAEVDHLRASHGVQAIKDKAAADIEAVRAFADQHVKLIREQAAKDVDTASVVLPPLNLPPAGPTGISIA